MDYLDPSKQRRHNLLLTVGYVLIAIAIGFATLVLVYEAYGFGLGKNGTVIQNGLVFVSSQPNPAQIKLNGVLNSASTNARLVLPSGMYHLQLNRDGYRPWQRTIEVGGGAVIHYDYPFLFPSKLVTTARQTYAGAPTLSTQSPDRRWLLVQAPGNGLTFDVYDLRSTSRASTTISLPGSVVTPATTANSWRTVEWADDNDHFVLRHDFDGKTEFIEVDRSNPDQSQNLNSLLGVSPSKLTLNNAKYDQFYVYDSASGTLQTASLRAIAPVTVLDHVLAYKTYGTDGILYATSSDAPAGKVLIRLRLGGQTYELRSFPAGTNYLLDLTKYAGTLYVVAGASNENKVYIYNDPVSQLQSQPSHAIVPSQVLHVVAPTYAGFSPTAQFVVVEHGTQFGVYDIFNANGYNYTLQLPMDAPQPQATWMDGDRLTYVSGGKLLVFDYDGTNQQLLMPAAPTYSPAFTPDYKYVLQLTNDPNGRFNLTQTALLIPGDL